MPEDQNMLCLLSVSDVNNLQFRYIVGLSILLPIIIALLYHGFKVVLQSLSHKNKNTDQLKTVDTDTDTSMEVQAQQQPQPTVAYRFRRRQINKQKLKNGVLASGVVPNEHEIYESTNKMCGDGDLRHFTHRHPMLRFHLRGKEGIRCNFCSIVISGVAYGCENCNYFIHHVCSEIPQEIRHDFHPKHSLILRSMPSVGSGTKFHCVGCGYDNTHHAHHLFDFCYRCDLCEFELHVECASMPETLNNRVKYPLDLFMSFPIESEGATLYCDICHHVVEKDSNWVYYNREFDYICHFECGAEHEYGVLGDSDFLSEVQKLLLLRRSCPRQQHGQVGGVTLTHFSHRHPLTALKQINPINETSASIKSCCICSATAQSGYICCKGCDYFIDEYCLNLPRRIRHEYHHDHPLILSSYTDIPKGSHCMACEQKIGALYRCAACDYSLHRTCGSAPKTMLILGTSTNVTYKLFYSFPFEGENADILCSHCSNTLNSKQSLLYYSFDLDDVLHVPCALNREAKDDEATKFQLTCERLNKIRV